MITHMSWLLMMCLGLAWLVDYASIVRTHAAVMVEHWYD